MPGSFETVGHIAHLNIREEAMPWRKLIGRVILDKNASIKTVVTKVGTIETEVRPPSRRPCSLFFTGTLGHARPVTIPMDPNRLYLIRLHCCDLAVVGTAPFGELCAAAFFLGLCAACRFVSGALSWSSLPQTQSERRRAEALLAAASGPCAAGEGSVLDVETRARWAA